MTIHVSKEERDAVAAYVEGTLSPLITMLLVKQLSMAAVFLREQIAKTNAAAPLLTHKADAEPSNMVQAERDRCAAIADDEAAIREKAGLTHPEDSPARDRCFAGARAAANVARGIRNGEVLETHKAEDAPSDAMVDAYLTAQRAAVEEADRFGRPNVGGLHTNTVREACRAGLRAAIAQERKA